jgi:ABC-type Fe3+-siderophore transport system permease subunit
MIRALRSTEGRRATLRAKRPAVSFRIDLRAVVVLIALGLVVLAGIVANVGYGEYPIGPLDVVRTVLGMEVGDGNYDFIANTLRLPRALAALLVGGALAISGAILQGLTRNPLAAPDIVGVNAGAGLAAVTLIVVLPSVPAAFIPPAAFGGAFVVAALLYVLAWKGHSSPIRLILIGVGLGAVATALTTVMIVFGDIYQVSQALIWLTGSVYGRSWGEIWPLLPWLVVFVPLAFLHSRHLNALNLGDDVAKGIGSARRARPRRTAPRERRARRLGGRHRRDNWLRGAHGPTHSAHARRAVPRRAAARLRHDRRGARRALRPRGPDPVRPHRDTVRHHHLRCRRSLLPLPALQEPQHVKRKKGKKNSDSINHTATQEIRHRRSGANLGPDVSMAVGASVGASPYHRH